MSSATADAVAGLSARVGRDADARPHDYTTTRLAATLRRRDTRIDSLRGLMLVEIALVHIYAPVALYSHECFGRISPAAGFVFLSGLVAGAVYSRTAEQGAAAILQRGVRRSLYIHAYHLAAFLALLAVAALVPGANTYFHFPIGASGAGVAHVLGWFALWSYQPKLFDILPMYGLFVLCMPAALLALRANRGMLMLAVSLGVWAVAQLGLGRIANADHFGFFQGYFNPFAWQFVFFSGLYVGHMHLYRREPVCAVRPGLLLLALLGCFLGFTMRWHLLHWPAPLGDSGWLSSKSNYGAAYLVNFLAFSYVVYWLATRFPRGFEWPALAYLGRHSLQVFTFHVVAVYLALPLVVWAAAHGRLAHNALGAALVASLFIPAWCHAKWRAAASPARPLPPVNARSAAQIQ